MFYEIYIFLVGSILRNMQQEEAAARLAPAKCDCVFSSMHVVRVLGASLANVGHL